MDIGTVLHRKQYLLKKIDFFATYISDFCGLYDTELNSLQTYALVEQRTINPEVKYFTQKHGHWHSPTPETVFSKNDRFVC
jgi:hypothetical protein